MDTVDDTTRSAGAADIAPSDTTTDPTHPSSEGVIGDHPPVPTLEAVLARLAEMRAADERDDQTRLDRFLETGTHWARERSLGRIPLSDFCAARGRGWGERQVQAAAACAALPRDPEWRTIADARRAANKANGAGKASKPRKVDPPPPPAPPPPPPPPAPPELDPRVELKALRALYARASAPEGRRALHGDPWATKRAIGQALELIGVMMRTLPEDERGTAIGRLSVGVARMREGLPPDARAAARRAEAAWRKLLDAMPYEATTLGMFGVRDDEPPATGDQPTEGAAPEPAEPTQEAPAEPEEGGEDHDVEDPDDQDLDDQDEDPDEEGGGEDDEDEDPDDAYERGEDLVHIMSRGRR